MKQKFEIKFSVTIEVESSFAPSKTETFSEIADLPVNKGVCCMDKKNCTYIAALKYINGIFKPKSRHVRYHTQIINIKL